MSFSGSKMNISFNSTLRSCSIWCDSYCSKMFDVMEPDFVGIYYHDVHRWIPSISLYNHALYSRVFN